MLLPEYVDKKFKNAEGFSNEVERAEKRKDSQLYVEWLLALRKKRNNPRIKRKSSKSS